MSKEGNAGGADRLSPALGDWRIARTGWVTAIGETQLDVPLASHQVSAHQAKRALVSHAFVTPSPSALHLTTAWRTAEAAAATRGRVSWQQRAPRPGFTEYLIGPGAESTLYDFFELLMVTAMSSFAAVEAYCNTVIVDRASGPIHVKRKDGPLQMTAEEIERNVSTDEKLKRIVPELLGVPSPAGKRPWNGYVKLKELRDAVTHFKRRDQARTAGESHEPTALLQSWRTDPYALPEAAMDIIRYFHKPEDLPRWMFNPAWKRPADPMPATSAGTPS